MYIFYLKSVPTFMRTCLNEFLDEASEIRRNNLQDGTYFFRAHYLFPLVGKIGCNEVIEENEKDKWCFFLPGIPEKYLNGFDCVEPKYLFLDSGEAGSKCEYDYENDDGLCKHTGTTTVPTRLARIIDFSQIKRSNCRKKMRLLFLALFIFPLVSSDWTGPQFVNGLNEGRREFAKQEKVPNMRELVWSDDLAQQVNYLSPDLYNNEERKAELFGRGSTYRDRVRDFFEGRNRGANLMVRDPPGARRQLLTAHYAFPLFDKVGCNNTYESPINRTLCYWSPGISEETSNILISLVPGKVFTLYGEAGSKCENGYENNDGLCKYTGVTTMKKNDTENSENDVPTESSTSNSMFSLVHTLVVFGFGYSIFT
ncbi:unnamed protein product [Caenorhabditis nigoni]